MKWILIISMVHLGQPVELSRSTGDNPPMPTRQVCETAGILVLAMMLRNNPEFVGKIFYECADAGS